MSEEVKSATKQAPKVLLEVKGNPLVETEFQRSADKKGVTYPALSKEYVIQEFKKLEEAAKSSPLFDLLPISQIAKIAFSRSKQLFQAVAEDCCDVSERQNVKGETIEETDWSTFDLQEFAKILVEGKVTSRGETKAELVTQLEEAGDELVKVIMGEITFATSEEKDERIKELGSNMQDLKEAIAAKSRVHKKGSAEIVAPAVAA